MFLEALLTVWAKKYMGQALGGDKRMPLGADHKKRAAFHRFYRLGFQAR
jgi:hypothetical protein